jgi:RimJ/RimL family protein N-acetyltransferase
MIVGERVRLRPIERSDLAQFVAWLANPDVCAHLDLVLGPGIAQEEQWFATMLARPVLEQPLAIEARLTPGEWHLVGSAGTHGVDWRNRTTEIGLVIGDPSAWGRGIGTEVTRLFLRHAFATLNLHRVWLRVYADNAAARRVYEKAGFLQEGTQREADFRDGRYRDVEVYSILESEWRQLGAHRAPTRSRAGRKARVGRE